MALPPPARTSSAQAPERSGETWGKCPEKARSRSGHALVASWSCTGLGQLALFGCPGAAAPRTARRRQLSRGCVRGPRADRPGSAHDDPFAGMRGSLPRAPACAGAFFSGSRRRSRLLADPLRRGWRPRWRGLHSHPPLLAVCVPTGRDPRPVASRLRPLTPGVKRQCENWSHASCELVG